MTERWRPEPGEPFGYVEEYGPRRGMVTRLVSLGIREGDADHVLARTPHCTVSFPIDKIFPWIPEVARRSAFEKTIADLRERLCHHRAEVTRIERELADMGFDVPPTKFKRFEGEWT